MYVARVRKSLPEAEAEARRKCIRLGNNVMLVLDGSLAKRTIELGVEKRKRYRVREIH